MILDWDVHHGNGTNDIFQEDKDVLFVSIHRHDNGHFYPGEGAAEDIGTGDGEGYCINVPLDKGYGDVDMEYVMKKIVSEAADRFRPEFMLVSSGFDALVTDPLGDCRVTAKMFGWMTFVITQVALRHCQGRLAVVCEGGYSLPALGKAAEAVVLNLLAKQEHEPLAEDLPSYVDWPGLPKSNRAMRAELGYFSDGSNTPGSESGSATPSSSCFSNASPVSQASRGSGAMSPGSKGPTVKPRTKKAVEKVLNLHSKLALGMPPVGSTKSKVRHPKNSKSKPKPKPYTCVHRKEEREDAKRRSHSSRGTHGGEEGDGDINEKNNKSTLDRIKTSFSSAIKNANPFTGGKQKVTREN